MGLRVAMGSEGTPGDPGGMSILALGKQAAAEGHSLGKEGERSLGNSCLDREAVIKLM